MFNTKKILISFLPLLLISCGSSDLITLGPGRNTDGADGRIAANTTSQDETPLARRKALESEAAQIGSARAALNNEGIFIAKWGCATSGVACKALVKTGGGPLGFILDLTLCPGVAVFCAHLADQIRQKVDGKLLARQQATEQEIALLDQEIERMRPESTIDRELRRLEKHPDSEWRCNGAGSVCLTDEGARAQESGSPEDKMSDHMNDSWVDVKKKMNRIISHRS